MKLSLPFGAVVLLVAAAGAVPAQEKTVTLGAAVASANRATGPLP